MYWLCTNSEVVEYVFRTSAEEAIQRMQGYVIGQQAVRLSWGKSPTNKPVIYVFCLIIVLIEIYECYLVVYGMT